MTDGGDICVCVRVRISTHAVQPHPSWLNGV